MEGESEGEGEGGASWIVNLSPLFHDPEGHRQPHGSFAPFRDCVSSSLGFALGASVKAREFHDHRPHVTRVWLRVWMQ